jgi:hypothetical protein
VNWNGHGRSYFDLIYDNILEIASGGPAQKSHMSSVRIACVLLRCGPPLAEYKSECELVYCYCSKLRVLAIAPIVVSFLL